MSRGRPRATYLDDLYEYLDEMPQGSWVLETFNTQSSLKIVKKLRREGVEVKSMSLGGDLTVLALRRPHELGADG